MLGIGEHGLSWVRYFVDNNQRHKDSEGGANKKTSKREEANGLARDTGSFRAVSIQRERLNVPVSSHEAACVHYLVH